MIRSISLVASLIVVAALAPSARAFDQNTELNEARVAISNAVIQEVKNGHYVKFALKWAYLPQSPRFTERMAEAFGFWEGTKGTLWDEYVVSNDVLKDPDKRNKWYQSLPVERKRLLHAALTKEAVAGQSTEPDAALRSEDLAAALAKGATAWNADFMAGLGFGGDGASASNVSWFNYVTSRRDFYSMLYLLSDARGAAAVLQFKPDPRGPNPMVVKDINWHIRVFNQSPGGDSYYRFAVEAQSGTISKTFSSGASSTATTTDVAVTVGLLQQVTMNRPGQKPLTYYSMKPVTVATGKATETLNNLPGASDVQPITAQLSPSSGGAILQAVTGQTEGSIIGPLFNNAANAAPITGALIGSGRTTPVYGINYLLTDLPDGNLGIAYGVTPKKDYDLYLGPTFQFGPFTASIGGLLYGRKDGSASGKLAGMLSLDLARVFGGGPKPTELIPTPKAGSSVWQDVDALYQDTMLLPYRMKVVGPAGALSLPRVKLTQIGDSNGKAPTTPFIANLPQGTVYIPLILPAGSYTIKSPDWLIQSVNQSVFNNASAATPLAGSAPQHLYTNLAGNHVKEQIVRLDLLLRFRGFPASMSVTGLPANQNPLQLVRTASSDGALTDDQKLVISVPANPTDADLPAGKYTITAPTGFKLSVDGKTAAAQVSIVVDDPSNAAPDLTADVRAGKSQVTITVTPA